MYFRFTRDRHYALSFRIIRLLHTVSGEASEKIFVFFKGET
jgi:hypothetical protein